MGQALYRKYRSRSLAEIVGQDHITSLLARAIDRGMNAPKASSCGRLFDAVACALGCAPDCLSYEGEAACRLEADFWQMGLDAAAASFLPAPARAAAQAALDSWAAAQGIAPPQRA